MRSNGPPRWRSSTVSIRQLTPSRDECHFGSSEAQRMLVPLGSGRAAAGPVTRRVPVRLASASSLEGSTPLQRGGHVPAVRGEL